MQDLICFKRGGGKRYAELGKGGHASVYMLRTKVVARCFLSNPHMKALRISAEKLIFLFGTGSWWSVCMTG